jgi:hypothetical protein
MGQALSVSGLVDTNTTQVSKTSRTKNLDYRVIDVSAVMFKV